MPRGPLPVCAHGCARRRAGGARRAARCGLAAVLCVTVSCAIANVGQVRAQVPVSDLSGVTDGLPPGVRRFRAWPRADGVQVNIQWFPSADGRESIAVVTGGINVVVDGLDDLGSVDVSTDRLVIWTGDVGQFGLGSESFQSQDAPLEFYMEGNIEFRQGERVVYASSMYYDVRNQVGVVLDAEMLTPVPEYEGKIRVQAERLRQVARDRFAAQNAKFTTSRIGEPGYWIQAGDVFFEDRQTPVIDPLTGLPLIDPVTGQQVTEHQRRATGRSNVIYVEGLPVFYWPRWTSTLDRPSFYLNDIALRNDDVFGAQILTDWNAYELFGLGPVSPGSDWELSLDYLSQRGPAAGTKFTYQQNPFPFLSPDAKGLLDAWFIHDTGLDNLGRDRPALLPETEWRGRVLFQHRHQLGNGYQLLAEAGWISDRNFLQEYFEREWNTYTDEVTRLALQRTIENRSWTIAAGARVDNFVTQSEWLPRGDHYWLGESLLGDRLTWFEHSQAGFAKLRTASAPENPLDAPWAPLPWEVSQNGERLVTRQEIDLPFALGPVNFVPYALGELAHWGADINGQPIDRAYGQVGVRSSLAMWNVNPFAHNPLFNVNGLAHKVIFDAELAYSDANQNVTDFPVYDPYNDYNLSAWERRLQTLTFGGPPVPARFDPRFYAIRSGIGSWVASPVTELVDDLTAVRLGARQRWQTKRGLPGDQRIIDWITFDTHLVLFPKDEQNFGDLVGLIDYDFRWHVGDRFTLLSSGLFDTFTDGQQLISVGGVLGRPDRLKLYLGLTSLEGPISTQVALASLSYRMSEKYIGSYDASIDISGDSNVAQRLALTRIGESFLVRVGVTVDESRNDVGVSLAVEPRLFRRAGRNLIEGIHVPPAGALGIE